jgi:hypothetical protein
MSLVLSAAPRDEDPTIIARAAAVCYLLDFAFGPGMMALGKIFVAHDATQTVANLMTYQTLFQIGFSGNLIAIVTYVGVVALFYVLFKPVNRTISVVAAACGLVGCAVLAFDCLFYYAPMVVLETGKPTAQSQQLVLLFFKLFSTGFNISIVFFSFYCLLIGYLVYKSGFIPWPIGILMMLAGTLWAVFLSPPLARGAMPWIRAAGTGELVLTLWLLVKGVDREKWIAMRTAMS